MDSLDCCDNGMDMEVGASGAGGSNNSGHGQIGGDLEDEPLFVFGYQSKIFRDDEKAVWIDKGQHLIPCLADSSLLVDRYDGRGALEDLKPFESHPNRDIHSGMSPQDLEIERLCDKERYRDYEVGKDEFDDSVVDHKQDSDDEEIDDEDPSTPVGRGPNRKSYAQIGYSYEDSTEHGPQPNPKPSKPKKRIKEDKPYDPPPGLYVPVDLVVPKTMKTHVVIEKTAKFIAAHGSQMEIIIKTKQASNPHLAFLNYNDSLNPYYKYLVHSIRTRTYLPVQTTTNSSSSNSDDSSGNDSTDEDENDGPGSYLHPSLRAPKEKDPSNSDRLINISSYKPIGESKYSALVSKIKEVSSSSASETVPPGSNEELSANTSSSHQQTLVPPNETKLVIEKMARYVVKNGPAFEDLALNKGDPRFSFLQPGSEYHEYYEKCKREYQVEADGVIAAEGFVQYNSNGKPKTSSTSTLSLVSYPEDPPLPTSEKIRQPETVLPTQTQETNQTKLSNFTVLLNPPPGPKPDHQNAINRMSKLPPQLLEKIEQLRKKSSTSGSGHPNSNFGVPPAPIASLYSIPSKNKIEISFKIHSTPSFQAQQTCQAENGTSELTAEFPGPVELTINSNINNLSTPINPEATISSEPNSTQILEDGGDENEELKRKREERKRKAQLFLQSLIKEKEVQGKKEMNKDSDLPKPSSPVPKENSEPSSAFVPLSIEKQETKVEPVELIQLDSSDSSNTLELTDPNLNLKRKERKRKHRHRSKSKSRSRRRSVDESFQKLYKNHENAKKRKRSNSHSTSTSSRESINPKKHKKSSSSKDKKKKKKSHSHRSSRSKSPHSKKSKRKQGNGSGVKSTKKKRDDH